MWVHTAHWSSHGLDGCGSAPPSDGRLSRLLCSAFCDVDLCDSRRLTTFRRSEYGRSAAAQETAHSSTLCRLQLDQHDVVELATRAVVLLEHRTSAQARLCPPGRHMLDHSRETRETCSLAEGPLDKQQADVGCADKRGDHGGCCHEHDATGCDTTLPAGDGYKQHRPADPGASSG